jgi:NET1-associated nuclear protein 1 (U3 small nucleolar RNA-associated protein 17)
MTEKQKHIFYANNTKQRHAHIVRSMAFTKDGSYLVSGGEEAVLVIWQITTGEKE